VKGSGVQQECTREEKPKRTTGELQQMEGLATICRKGMQQVADEFLSDAEVSQVT